MTQPNETAASETEAAATDTPTTSSIELMGDANTMADVSFEEGMLDYEQLVALYDESMRHLEEGQIVQGIVVDVTDNDVVVDVGYKSEGLIPLNEFADVAGAIEVNIGDEVEVLLEKTEDKEGHILLSKSKAVRMRIWNKIEQAYQDNEIINGRVMDRIKGGLTVDVGLRAFLPGSLVDIKPVKNLETLKGEELQFKVISLDRRRNNIVLSRKAVLEKEFAKKKKETIEKLVEGAKLPGVVKNITDYGVFVDLGGIDGLLHITDISWGRVNHPSEHFSVGDDVEIVVLKFDPESERVSLGYKQRSEDPWTLVDKKYPIGSRIRGKVVSLVDYGAFVEIEEGVEGLIHVSEMSWTKKVVNPSKLLQVGDEVEAIVSELDMEQRRISLSLRQTERNPWEELADTFPVGSIIEGKVRNLTEFGAFVEITDDIDGLIHVSDMSWTKRVKHPSEVLKKTDLVKAQITNIDVSNQRVSLSIKEFLPNEWDNFIETHHVGDTIDGKVVNVTDFGLFVDIYEGLEGLAHISEIDLASGKLEHEISDWVSARILRIEEDEKKVGLTMRGVPQPTPDEIPQLEAQARSSPFSAGVATESQGVTPETNPENLSVEQPYLSAGLSEPAPRRSAPPVTEPFPDEARTSPDTLSVNFDEREDFVESNQRSDELLKVLESSPLSLLAAIEVQPWTSNALRLMEVRSRATLADLSVGFGSGLEHNIPRLLQDIDLRKQMADSLLESTENAFWLQVLDGLIEEGSCFLDLVGNFSISTSTNELAIDFDADAFITNGGENGDPSADLASALSLLRSEDPATVPGFSDRVFSLVLDTLENSAQVSGLLAALPTVFGLCSYFTYSLKLANLLAHGSGSVDIDLVGRLGRSGDRVTFTPSDNFLELIAANMPRFSN